MDNVSRIIIYCSQKHNCHFYILCHSTKQNIANTYAENFQMKMHNMKHLLRDWICAKYMHFMGANISVLLGIMLSVLICYIYMVCKMHSSVVIP